MEYLGEPNREHTAASLAIAAGANVKAVQRMLGHASAAMTLDSYAGLFGDDLDGVADALDDVVPRTRRVGAGEVASSCWRRPPWQGLPAKTSGGACRA